MAAIAAPGCSRSCATRVIPGCNAIEAMSGRRRSTTSFIAASARRRTQRHCCCNTRTSSSSDRRWKPCRWSFERWWSCANWRGCRTKRSPGSPTCPWGRSCHVWPVPASGCRPGWSIACSGRSNVHCQETQALLNGYVDGELDVVRSVEVEQHLQDCQACTHVYKNHQALRSAITGGELYFRPPAHLHKRVRAAVRQAHHADTRTRVWPWRGLSAAASLAAVALLVWSLVPMLTGPSANDLLTRELIAGHVRSLMASHMTDVASSD